MRAGYATSWRWEHERVFFHGWLRRLHLALRDNVICDPGGSSIDRAAALAQRASPDPKSERGAGRGRLGVARMTPRRRRMVAMSLGLVTLAAAAVLVFTAFEQNLLYFYTPTQIAEGEVPTHQRLRVGGLVERGSVRRSPGSLEVRFDVTDLDQTITVAYAGVLPDLFREGQGVIAHGRLGVDGLMHADEVLARHDENYMPPEVAEMLEERGHPPDASLP